MAVLCELKPDAHAQANLLGKPEIDSRDYIENEQPGVKTNHQTQGVI